MTKQIFLRLLERELEKVPFFSATHKITYIAGYTLSYRLDFQPFCECGCPPRNYNGAGNAGSQNGWKSSLTLSTHDEYWARYDHIWTLSQCVVNYTIINELNNKTIILLNLA